MNRKVGEFLQLFSSPFFAYFGDTLENWKMSNFKVSKLNFVYIKYYKNN